jgi:hypothetical protein
MSNACPSHLPCHPPFFMRAGIWDLRVADIVNHSWGELLVCHTPQLGLNAQTGHLCPLGSSDVVKAGPIWTES